MNPQTETLIKETISKNPVVVFMKGSPDMPRCGFSAQVIKILRQHKQQPFGVDILTDPELRAGIKEFTNWPTLPQVFVKGEFIGGCDILIEMDQNGELQTKLSSI